MRVRWPVVWNKESLAPQLPIVVFWCVGGFKGTSSLSLHVFYTRALRVERRRTSVRICGDRNREIAGMTVS